MIIHMWFAMAVALATAPGVAWPPVQMEGRKSFAAVPDTLAPCRHEDVEGELLCGAIEVWEDRVAAKGRRIMLNIAVLRALDGRQAAEPLFVFVGGPGQAATADVSSNARRFATIRRTRDIVMIDQRGTGRSNPLNCYLGTPRSAVGALVASEPSLGLITACRRNLERTANLRLYTTQSRMISHSGCS